MRRPGDRILVDAGRRGEEARDEVEPAARGPARDDDGRGRRCAAARPCRARPRAAPPRSRPPPGSRTGCGPRGAPRRPGLRSARAGDRAGSAGSAGKSSSIQSRSRAARRTPERVSKRRTASSGSVRSSHSTWALARVACPQRSTSTAGVNHRRAYTPGDRRRRNAVSERFISPATLRIQVSSTGWESRQTAAGLPWNNSRENASTWTSFTSIAALRGGDRRMTGRSAGGHRATGSTARSRGGCTTRELGRRGEERGRIDRFLG